MIPKIIHFINLGPREFNLLHFLSIYSAYSINKPDQIYLYCDHIQKNNFYWNILTSLDIINVELVENTEYHKDIYLENYQYRADVLRLEKLIQRGGIYLDLDIICLKPFDYFLNNNLVLGVESSDNNEEIDIYKINSITNAVILAEPYNKFIINWYNMIADNIQDKPWAYHAVVLPLNILKQNLDIYNPLIVPSSHFIPFDFMETFILEEEINKEYLIKDSFTIHLWETIWSNDDKLTLTINYFNESDSLFVLLFSKYINILKDHLYLLENIIDNVFLEKKNINKLYDSTNIYIDLCYRYDKFIHPRILTYNSYSKSILKHKFIKPYVITFLNNIPNKKSCALYKYVNKEHYFYCNNEIFQI